MQRMRGNKSTYSCRGSGTELLKVSTLDSESPDIKAKSITYYLGDLKIIT